MGNIDIDKLHRESSVILNKLNKAKKDSEGMNEMVFANTYKDYLSRYFEIDETIKLYLNNKNIQEKSKIRGFISKNKDDVLKLNNNKCYVCEIDFVYMLVIHHIKPLNKGGNNNINNLAVLCPNCHKMVHLLISENFLNKNNDGKDWTEGYFKTTQQKIRFMELIEKGIRST